MALLTLGLIIGILSPSGDRGTSDNPMDLRSVDDADRWEGSRVAVVHAGTGRCPSDTSASRSWKLTEICPGKRDAPPFALVRLLWSGGSCHISPHYGHHQERMPMTFPQIHTCSAKAPSCTSDFQDTPLLARRLNNAALVFLAETRCP